MLEITSVGKFPGGVVQIGYRDMDDPNWGVGSAIMNFTAESSKKLIEFIKEDLNNYCPRCGKEL